MKSFKEIGLSFYGLHVTIRSDSPAWVELFSQMYTRFLTDEATAGSAGQLSFEVFTHPENRYGTPVLVSGDAVTRLPDPGLADGYVYELILHEILRKVQSHFLIHAGVVSRNGGGILIAGVRSMAKRL